MTAHNTHRTHYNDNPVISGQSTIDFERGYGLGWMASKLGTASTLEERCPVEGRQGWRRACDDYRARLEAGKAKP